MPGRAIVSNVSFGDTTLPKIDITYIQPLVGALYDFAVDQLPLGPVASWPSLVDGLPLVADGTTTPTVITDGASKTVRFNGTIDRMQINVNLNTAHSIVAVAKLRTPVASDQIVYGKASNTEGALGINSGGTSFNANGGGQSLSMSPVVAPDANWHVFILSHQGTSSALRVDNAETLGNVPVAQRNGITLGFGNLADLRSEVDYKRVALIPGTMTTAQRTAIVAQLKGQYGI
ncbi:hypothetical protein ACFRJ8_14640 [Arthrobacter sp. NPDC056886]|uniref:hypothetical protein n=1 Tax=Arthrobacter sp. NPDC056886 TaxID=3345960 RepID=UPI00366C2DD6